MPVEECGDMIIMTLAYAQHASDTAYLEQHYDILKQWTGYFIEDALIPANQLSTDDFQGQLANQTNLALKGIIAIEAMSVISQLTGNLDDGKNISTTAHNYLDKWQQYAIVHNAAFPHANLDFQDDTSHGMPTLVK
jgi:restriction endonuclease